MNNSKLHFILVFLICFVSFLPAATLVGIFQVSEAREGVVVQQILSTDNWVLPLRHSVIVPSKPPLFHWIGAGFARVCGEYNLLLLRIPSMLAASLLTAFFYTFAVSLMGNFYGILATLAILTTYGFYHLAVDGRVDMLFAAFVFIAISLWLKNALSIFQQRMSYRDISELTYLLVAICCGLAVLTKGPLGLVLPAMTIFLVAYGLWGFWGALSTIRISWALSLILPAIWYYLAWKQGGDAFVERHLFFENLKRFSGGTGVNQKPWWFYLSHIWGQAAPWSVFFIFPSVGKRVFQKLKQKNPEVLSLLIWIISSLIFFSLSSGKRRAYLLPLLPPLVLLFSLIVKDLCSYAYLQRVKIRVFEWFEPIGRRVAASFFPAIMVIFCITVANLLKNFSFSLRIEMARDAFLQIASINFSIILALLLLLSFVCLYFFSQALKRNILEFFLAAVLVLNLQIVAVVLPFFTSIKSITHSMSGLKNLATESVPAGEVLTAVKFYTDESLDVFFYLYNRPTTILKPNKLSDIKTGYYISPIRYLPRVEKAINQSGQIFNKLAVGKRPSDDENQSFVIFKVN